MSGLDLLVSDIAPPGTILAGKYKVERTLGEGGMGVVVAAMHEILGQRVAVKFLRPHLCSDQGIVSRFVREARMASRVQSEHVARVIDVGNLENGSPYMVMEYLEGQDLGEVLRDQGAMPMPLVLDYVLQASEAIAEAHKIGIVHRDLKPSNFFLTQRADGSPLIKVLDFGISKFTETAMAPMDAAALTQTQNILGSPLYMSPEQLRSAKNVDARADVWALGVILYEMMAGKPPFMGESVSHLLTVIVADPHEPLVIAAPSVPQAVSDIVDRCLTKNRDQRIATVAQLARDLLPYAPRHARLSVERIARLAGAEAPPESLAQTRIQLDSGGHPVLTSQPPPAPSSEEQGPLLPSGASLPEVVGVSSQSSTAEPVSSAQSPANQSELRDKRSRLPLVAGAALIGALVLFFGFRAARPSGDAAKSMTPTSADTVAAVSADPPKPIASLAPLDTVAAAPALGADAGAVALSAAPTPSARPSTSAKPASAASVKVSAAAPAHSSKPSAGNAYDPLGGRN